MFTFINVLPHKKKKPKHLAVWLKKNSPLTPPPPPHVSDDPWDPAPISAPVSVLSMKTGQKSVHFALEDERGRRDS